MQSLDLVWWSPPLGFVAVALSFIMCIASIGPRRQIMRHKAGELPTHTPTKFLTMLNLEITVLLTGAEDLHDHHQNEPQSTLYLLGKAFRSPVIDNTETILLVFEKIGWVKTLRIAPQFAA